MIAEVASDIMVEIKRERRSANVERASDAVRDARRQVLAAVVLWRRAASSLREIGEHAPLILIEDAAKLGDDAQMLANAVFDACAARGFGAVECPVREVV